MDLDGVMSIEMALMASHAVLFAIDVVFFFLIYSARGEGSREEAGGRTGLSC